MNKNYLSNSLTGQFILLVNERLEKLEAASLKRGEPRLDISGREEQNLLKEVLKLGIAELENVSKIY